MARNKNSYLYSLNILQELKTNNPISLQNHTFFTFLIFKILVLLIIVLIILILFSKAELNWFYILSALFYNYNENEII